MKPCIFCGEFAHLTKEHIWGDWIRAYVPADANKHSIRDVEIIKGGTPDKITITNRTGSAIGSRRKIVCATCNNTWMSRLQNKAKPYLIPLLEGRQTALGVEAFKAIAAWATMVTMTAEYQLNSAGKIAVSQDDRALLKKTEGPIPEWFVWIGHYRGGKWRHQWTHTSLPIVGGEQLPSADFVYTPLPNTQTTTFVVGELYVHTMRSLYPDLCGNWHWLGTRLRYNLIPIWPIRHEFIVWPFHVLSDADVTASSDMFIKFCESAVHGTGF
jgi:hypothetical protein